MHLSKWRSEILHEIEYLVFHNYFFFFSEKNNFYRNSPFPVQSVFVINISLFTSVVTVKMDYMENARYATNDDTPL